jgi:hypothetical protein
VWDESCRNVASQPYTQRCDLATINQNGDFFAGLQASDKHANCSVSQDREQQQYLYQQQQQQCVNSTMGTSHQEVIYNAGAAPHTHPQASFSMNVTATAEMTGSPSLYMPQPSAQQSELEKLLTQQTSSPQDTTLPHFPPDVGVWSESIPQLTGDDIDILDLVTT